MQRSVTLSTEEIALLLDPWYHDFSALGLATAQRAGIWGPNQAAKQSVLFGLIDDALECCMSAAAELSVLELFCADGFFGLYAAQRGASQVLGVDKDPREIAKARLAAKVLGANNVTFEVRDVFDTREPVSVALCAGGLYHLADPERLLAQLRERVELVLVVQTVYNLMRDEPDYFEAPAPGWTWGCRFSYAYLKAMVERTGWAILGEQRNQLPGNERGEDRGSAYLFCAPA